MARKASLGLQEKSDGERLCNRTRVLLVSAVAETGGFCVIVCNNPGCTDKTEGRVNTKIEMCCLGMEQNPLAKMPRKEHRKLGMG